MSKTVRQYQIQVSTRGPIKAQCSKSGRGVYIVAETDPEKAIKALKAYFKEYNLFGSMYPAYELTSEWQKISLERGTVMTKEQYLELAERKRQPGYVFAPAKTGQKKNQRRQDCVDAEDRNRQVFGAFQKPSDIEQIDDCGELHNVEGVTYEGAGLGDYLEDFEAGL